MQSSNIRRNHTEDRPIRYRLTEHTATRPVPAGELELHRDSGPKMVFQLLLSDTWHADINAGING